VTSPRGGGSRGGRTGGRGQRSGGSRSGGGRSGAGGGSKKRGAAKKPAKRGAKRSTSGAARGRSSGGLVSRRAFLTTGIAAAALVGVGAATDSAATRLNEFGAWDSDRLRALRSGSTTLLLERFPRLAEHVPWRPLGSTPTPVEALPSLAGAGDVRLFVKRDDRASALYGGNKVRKLEHYLAEAAAADRRTLITMGAIGTNHGLATALFGRRLGFDVKVVMFDQPLTPWVERNLRAFAAAGATLHYAGGEIGAVRLARSLYADAEAAGEAPYFIMIGGSSRLGSLGYVNAGLELGEQVRAGAVPEPDRIFVALGSGGTAAGLAVGCRLAGLRTRITAVRVSSVLVANSLTVHWMAKDLAAWLRRMDPAVPRVRVGFGDFDIIGNQLGEGYGHPSEAGRVAMEWAADRLALEPTYTAKTLAACLAHCRGSARPGETVLYWNTANTATLEQAASLDALPPRLRQRLQRG
jgi:D-cysteine desulfhydrase